MKRSYFLILVISVSLCSCAKLIFGLHDTKALDKKEIISYSEKYNIPPADNFSLDTTYFRFLNAVDTFFYKPARKNHYQPLQALYYDKEGKLRVFIINCYTSGIPNLKWNRKGILETFPPRQQAPVDSILPLYEHLKFVKPLPGAQGFSFGKDEYVVMVYWSRFMGRQSKRLIKAIQANVKLAGDKKVRVIYVNTDNFFTKALKTSR